MVQYSATSDMIDALAHTLSRVGKMEDILSSERQGITVNLNLLDLLLYVHGKQQCSWASLPLEVYQ